MTETREPFKTFSDEPCEPLFMVELIDRQGKSHGYIGYRFHAPGAQAACDGWNSQRDAFDLVAVIKPVEPEPVVATPEQCGEPGDCLEKKLERFVNAHSLENRSNTPDFLLGSFLASVLTAADTLVNARDRWYGVALQPGMYNPIEQIADLFGIGHELRGDSSIVVDNVRNLIDQAKLEKSKVSKSQLAHALRACRIALDSGLPIVRQEAKQLADEALSRVT